MIDLGIMRVYLQAMRKSLHQDGKKFKVVGRNVGGVQIQTTTMLHKIEEFFVTTGTDVFTPS